LCSCSGSIPVTLDFANILGLNVLLLPVGRGDDGEFFYQSVTQPSSFAGAHSTNEKIDTDNYIRVT
jgi:Cys-Gly metallodipeptidase DUG1